MAALALLAGAAEGAEGTIELPMDPIGYGLIALAVFAGLFGLTWAFRSVGTRHDDAGHGQH